jgi:hypothetical protein
MQYNGVTTTTYDWQGMASTGAGAPTGVTGANGTSIRCGITHGGGANAGCFGDIVVDIVGYATGTTAQRYAQTRIGCANTNVAFFSEHNMGHWQSTAAITTIKIFGSGGTDWAAGSLLICELYP